jgi:outer membrane protein assembly factor BamB
MSEIVHQPRWESGETGLGEREGLRMRRRCGGAKRGCAPAVSAVLLALTLASCGSGSRVAAGDGNGSSYAGLPNGDFANTRAVGGPIDATNVRKLKVAWTWPLTARSLYGSYSGAPIVKGGVVYTEDLASNVRALSLRTGHLIWQHEYNEPDQGPNGVAVAQGLVFGATPNAAFALNANTGGQLWSVKLVRNEHEGIDMAPGYHEGMVYVSTVPGNNRNFYRGGGVGTLWALDARTGARLWHFDTVPRSLWGHPTINSGGGLWYTPAFDDDGAMYIGVGNPAPFPGITKYHWGSTRPGPDLYTDSVVKLNAKTGAVIWHYQLTPHDIYDWDLQDPPILVTVGGRHLVVAAGKAGIVIALDASTGKLIWKRAVGVHNGHDHDSLFALKGEYSRLKVPETVEPGLLGGVIAPMATDGKSVFVPVVNNPVTFSIPAIFTESESPRGELAALNLATGVLEWRRNLPAAAYGAMSVANNVVFATDIDGRLAALRTTTGQPVWEQQLPASTNTGVTVSGDTVIAPAGLAVEPGQKTELVAYRLG